MTTRKALIFPFFLFTFLCPIVLAQNLVFNLSPETVCLETWKGFNNDAIGNASFVYGKFVLWINDTSGGWGLSKISRGLMPHYWGLRYALLDNEVEFTTNYYPNLILDIDLKLIEYQNYTVSNSSMNVAIVLFFDGYITNYQEKCYQTEIQFFSYYGDKIQKGQQWFFTWRNDNVAQFKLEDNLQQGIFKHYSMNMTPYIKIMMQQYGLSHAKLKHIEIFTEAYKGYSKFEVYSAKIIIDDNETQKWYQDPKTFGLIGFSFFFVCLLLYYFFKEYVF
jgi:hypothetical protein